MTSEDRDAARRDRNMLTAILDGVYQNATLGYLVTDLEGFVLLEGGAPGADDIASWWADNSPMHSYGEKPDDPPFEHLKFKADWETHGRFAGAVRNEQMLDEGKPDLVLAFPDKDSVGTWDMVRQAKKAGIETWVIKRA